MLPHQSRDGKLLVLCGASDSAIWDSASTVVQPLRRMRIAHDTAPDRIPADGAAGNAVKDWTSGKDGGGVPR